MRLPTVFLSALAAATAGLVHAGVVAPDQSPAARSAAAEAEELFARAPGDPVCKKPAVAVVVLVLKAFPSPASKVCSTVLKRTPPATVTVTNSVTATATSTNTVLTTTVQTTTIQVTTTAWNPLRVRAGLDEFNGRLETVYYAARDARATAGAGAAAFDLEPRKAKKLGDLLDKLPGPIASLALDIASSACDCFLPPVVTPTATATASLTTTSVVQSTQTNVVVSTVTDLWVCDA